MVFDIFSKRAKRQSGADDVYQYKTIPDQTRVQIVHLWKRAVGEGYDYTSSRKAYVQICEVLHEEYGVFHLCKERRSEGFEELAYFFLGESDINRCLDAVELVMRVVYLGLRDNNSLSPEDVEQILNARLREGAVGYQYEGGRIIKVDHQLVHAEIVKPAISYLSDPVFKGANDEFMSAHKNYRAGEYKACLVDALKAFESTMKIVCKSRGWIPEGDTASKLISTILSNGLIPLYLQTQFNALKSILESGIPTVRNKTAGHGQGEQIQEVPDYLAAYVLHQTASAILFVVKAHQAKP